MTPTNSAQTELERALADCREPTVALVPADGQTVVPVAVYSASVALGTDALLAVPGVTVLAEGTHADMSGAVHLVEYAGERWIVASDDRTAIVNPGAWWAECVATGAIRPTWDAS